MDKSFVDDRRLNANSVREASPLSSCRPDAIDGVSAVTHSATGLAQSPASLQQSDHGLRYFQERSYGAALHNVYCDGMMTRRFICLLAWMLLAFILFATVSPITSRPHDFLPVQLDRALAFTLMAGGFIVAYPRHWVTVAALGIASAFAIETLQYLSSTRHAHLADAEVKAVGAAVGVLLGLAANKFREIFRQRCV